MSMEYCADCGMLLSSHTTICPGCGYRNDFENNSDSEMDFEQAIRSNDEFIPERYPGF